MNQEILERLVIDDALGELAPDTQALLEAHLKTSPELAKQASGIRETLRLAKLALAEPAGCATAIPLPENVIEFPVPAVKRTPSLNWLQGMAACFIGGLCLGFLLTHQFAGRTPQIAQIQPVETRDMDKFVAPHTLPDKSAFWSAQKYHPASLPAAPEFNKPIIWKSPLRKPQVLENI